MSVFLTAEWRHLLMLNYEVPREVLEPMVPRGTVLDTYQGKAYVSVVGFLFLNTRLKGISIPFHQDFEEINLRFYVRRFNGEEWRRGVVFVKEIVPKAAIAATARLVYNEQYACHPMRHSVVKGSAGIEVVFEWEVGGHWNRLAGVGKGQPRRLRPGSLEEFITEHYWGYTAQRDGGTLEYQVEHPSWLLWDASDVCLEGRLEAVYGPTWAGLLAGKPASAFIAEGSEVNVYSGVQLPG